VAASLPAPDLINIDAEGAEVVELSFANAADELLSGDELAVVAVQ
jgi:hypothetical protein